MLGAREPGGTHVARLRADDALEAGSVRAYREEPAASVKRDRLSVGRPCWGTRIEDPLGEPAKAGAVAVDDVDCRSPRPVLVVDDECKSLAVGRPAGVELNARCRPELAQISSSPSGSVDDCNPRAAAWLALAGAEGDPATVGRDAGIRVERSAGDASGDPFRRTAACCYTEDRAADVVRRLADAVEVQPPAVGGPGWCVGAGVPHRCGSRADELPLHAALRVHRPELVTACIRDREAIRGNRGSRLLRRSLRQPYGLGSIDRHSVDVTASREHQRIGNLRRVCAGAMRGQKCQQQSCEQRASEHGSMIVRLMAGV